MAVIAYLDIASAASDCLVAAHATDEDRAMANRRRTVAGRRQRLAVRALLRSLLATLHGDTAGWRLSRDDDGAPRLQADGVEQPPYLSLSHSGSMVACALDGAGPIGIDVERIKIDRPIVAISQMGFGPEECAAVEREGVEAFYRLWTLREALTKASGAGFGLLMNRLDLVPVSPDSSENGTWSFRYWRLPEHYGLGVVLRCPAAELTPLSPICASGL